MSSSNVEYRQLKVFQNSTDFREAVKVVNNKLVPPTADELLVKVLYVGINATDLNVTAGRYFAHDNIPYALGAEVWSCKQ